jgi:hypothetical protein
MNIPMPGFSIRYFQFYSLTVCGLANHKKEYKNSKNNPGIIQISNRLGIDF